MTTPRPMDTHIDNAEVVATLRSFIHAPVLPHIILYGPSGIGKTHLARMFIQEYFDVHGIPRDQQQKYTLAVPSSDDRGIKFVRTQVRDFAKEYHQGSYIIFMDDCDTLQVLSQQALRRIMEQHDSKTSFIFVANRINVFIDPIQSRCVVLRMTPVNMRPQAIRLAAEAGCNIKPSALSRLVALSVGNLRQFVQYLQVLALVLGDKQAIESDIEELCDAPPVKEIQELLSAHLAGDKLRVITACVLLWEKGFPLPDLLNYIQTVCNVYGGYDNENTLRINECVGRGAIMCIDNQVHLWDMIALFSSNSTT